MNRQWFGTYHAIVLRNDDPTGAQRVTLKVPQVLGNTQSQWAPPAAAKGTGVPAVGSVVTAMFLGGDINHPAYLSTFSLTSSQNWLGVFGDGSDGTVTLDGTTTYTGFSALVSSTYTLSRDVFATNFTINSGVTLNPNGWRIFCQGTFTNNGTVSTAGNSATSSSGAPFTGGGSLIGGNSGGGGGATTGSAGTSNNAPGTNTAGTGGTGPSGAGGTGGTSGGSTTAPFKVPFALLGGVFRFSGSNVSLNGGPGGGGGGGDGTNKGGGGGSGGGPIFICAWAAVNNGTFTTQGGNGFTPTAGNTGGGGGGSGGPIVVYTLTSWTAGTLNVSGGSAGSPHGTGTNNATAGGNGTILNQVLS